MPISREEVQFELAKAASTIATQCAIELSAKGLLSDQGAQAIRQTLLDIAKLTERAGAGVAETVFLKAAQEIERHQRR